MFARDGKGRKILRWPMRLTALALLVAPLYIHGANFDLGSRRELFVDHFLIEKMAGVELRQHEPLREGIALRFDRPWEGGFSGYVTVLKDGPAYRMFYRGLPEAGKDTTSAACTCYAESTNGVDWIKPNLRLFEVQGTLDNNVILTNAPFAHNFSPFLDARRDIQPNERYKALAGLSPRGLHAFKSPDGIHWTPVQKSAVFTNGMFDSQNVAFWSDSEEKYACYFRTLKKVAGDSFRWISRTASKDFVHWEAPVEMEFGDTPPEQFYTSGTHPYYRAPHIYIALAKRFFPTKAALAADEAKTLVNHPGYRVASSDSIFMATRGGSHFERASMDAFIRPGPDHEDWVSRDNTPALGVVPANDRTMFIYRMSHYAQPSSHVSRYSLRADGFISVHGPYAGGELVTKPISFQGNQLELNFQTSAAGGIRVEIEDETGKPMAGFSASECPEMIGDEISRIVRWTNGPDVRNLAGRPVRLRFLLKDADLYSFRFFKL